MYTDVNVALHVQAPGRLARMPTCQQARFICGADELQRANSSLQNRSSAPNPTT